MTDATSWSDETLVAWADGELADERVQALEQAMLTDAALAERAALMLETRAMAQLAWDAELHTPVPAALRASVEAMVAQDRANRLGQAAVTGAAGPAHRPEPTGGWLQRAQSWLTGFMAPLPMAMAASALCAGLGFMLGSATQPAGDSQLAQAQAPLSVGQALPTALAQALDRTGSGETAALTGGGELVPVATYATPAGELCREFSWALPSAERVEALACRSAGEAAWQVQMAARAVAVEDFAPAQAEHAFGPMLARLGAGEAMAPEAERAALAGLTH